MNRIARTTRIAAAVAISLAVALPATGALAASRKTNNALIGGAIGALAGALISDGDTTATLGGAAAGALIGSASTRDRYDRNDRRAYETRYQQPAYGYGRDYRVDDRRYDGRGSYNGYGHYERPVDYRYYGR